MHDEGVVPTFTGAVGAVSPGNLLPGHSRQVVGRMVENYAVDKWLKFIRCDTSQEQNSSNNIVHRQQCQASNVPQNSFTVSSSMYSCTSPIIFLLLHKSKGLYFPKRVLGDVEKASLSPRQHAHRIVVLDLFFLLYLCPSSSSLRQPYWLCMTSMVAVWA